MNVFSKVAVIAGLVGATTFAVANTTAVNQQALAPTQITTVKQALTLKNDTPVKLKGYVVKATGDEKYQFSDQTGSITVDKEARKKGTRSRTECNKSFTVIF